jgi:FAD/FMN-containing dehydrogenase
MSSPSASSSPTEPSSELDLEQPSLLLAVGPSNLVPGPLQLTFPFLSDDLTRLFIGSEGTLGVISSCTLRLKRIPSHKVAVTLQFTTLENACRLAHAIVERCIPLQRLEVMDAESVRSVNVHYDEELPVAPLMLLDVAGQTAGEVESLLKQTEELVGATRADFEAGKVGEGGKFGVVAWKMTWDEKEAENLWSTRKRAFFAAPSLRKEEIEKGAKMAVLVTDVAGGFD